MLIFFHFLPGSFIYGILFSLFFLPHIPDPDYIDPKPPILSSPIKWKSFHGFFRQTYKNKKNRNGLINLLKVILR